MSQTVKGVIARSKGAPVEMAFSPDGTVLATGSHDQTIKLWDLAAGKATTADARQIGDCALADAPAIGCIVVAVQFCVERDR